MHGITFLFMYIQVCDSSLNPETSNVSLQS